MINFPIYKQEIDDLSENDIEVLSELDSQGLLIGKNEDIEDYKKRLLQLESEIQDLNNSLIKDGKIEISKNSYLTKDRIISSDIISSKTAGVTSNAYSFTISWVPGFYGDEHLSLFTGGATIITDSGFCFFIIKSNFAYKSKWLLYSVEELLRHEICHIARSPLDDDKYEEFFAYRVSEKKFRKLFGNCFHNIIDTMIFIIPFFVLIFAQFLNMIYTLPMLYFRLAVIPYPVFLVIRNFYLMRKYNKAVTALENSGICDKADSVLFRCSAKEISKIAKLKNKKDKLINWLKDKSEGCLRWKVIAYSFLDINNN